MTLIFDSTNNTITLNNKTISILSSDKLSFLPTNIKQIYWYDNYGEIKYDDGSMKFIDKFKFYDSLVSLFYSEEEKEKQEYIENIKQQQKIEIENINKNRELEIQKIKEYEELEIQKVIEYNQKQIEKIKKEKEEQQRLLEEQREEQRKRDELLELKNKEEIEIRKKEDEEKQNSRDFWREFRGIRNYKLLETDWTQLPNAPITQEQKDEWENYRQALRNMPNLVTDPKPLVLDLNHPDWIQPPY
jgi:hypothetical protein